MATKKTFLPLTNASLIAKPSATSSPADLRITFNSGLGQATASLFRHGILINMQSISHSANIHFSDVESGDTVAVNGVCTGNAIININVPTTPSTPKPFSAGIIIASFLIN